MYIQKKLFFIVLLFSLPALSQTPEGKNMVKFNFSALLFKGFNVQYERQLLPKVTAALGYGIIPLSSIPFKSYIKDQVYIPNVNVSDYRAGTFVFTPEVRYYFGKKGAYHGFYLAPYARLGFYKINGPIIYSNSSGQNQRADFSGKLTAITGGLLVGSAWQLSDKFYLDCWIAGASFGGENGKFTASSALSPSDQESLRKNLNSISLKYITLTSEVNNNGAIVKTSGNIAGVRGLGINLGFKF
jgi:hypothetical protein